MKRFRLIAFLTALCVFCSCVPVLAEDTVADTAGQTLIESDAFYALGTMDLLTEDFLNIGAGSAVTRAQFLGALYKLAGLPGGTADVILPFDDVDENTPHRDAISYFYGIGAVSGSGSNTFEPDSKITYIQAVKIISDFLGYKLYVRECLGAYPMGYLLMAEKLDLGYGIEVEDINSPICAEAIIRLIYNSANAPLSEAEVYNDKGEVVSYSSDKDRTLLSVYNSIYYREDILQDNGVVSLDGEPSEPGKVVIGGKKFRSADFDLTDYLGMEISFFYRSTDEADTVLWACPNGYNDILTIKSADLIKDDPSYGVSRIVYYENERRKTGSIDEFADIVYNNALSNDASAEYLKPQAGELKLIDNDGDRDYDIVIVKDFRNVYVNAVSAEKEFISNLYGDTLDLSVYRNVKIFNENGKKTDMNEIVPGRIVSYLANPHSTDNIYIYINKAGTKAKLEAFSDDGEHAYTFDGTEYRIAQSLTEVIESGMYYVPEVKVGQTYEFCLDIEGNIAAVKLVGDTEQYAYFIGAKYDTNSFASGDSYMVKLLLSDGLTTVVTTSDKFKMLGYDDGTSLCDKIPQVVMVKFDEDGCLKEIKFPTPLDREAYPFGFNKDEFTLDYAPEKAYYRTKVFDGSYSIDGTTLVFATLLGYDGEVTYEVIGSSTIREDHVYRQINHNGETYSAPRFYDADEYMHVNVMEITLRMGDFVNNDINMLVDEVRRYIDTDGNEGIKIVGLLQGKMREYTVDSADLIPVGGLKRGDIIRFAMSGNRVYRVIKTCSLSDPNLQLTDTSEAAGVSAGYSVACGYLYSNDGVNINLYKPDGWNNGSVVLVSPTRSNENMLISIYDAAQDKVYPGIANQLYQNCTPRSDGTLDINEKSTKVFISRRYGYITSLFAVYY